MNKFKSEVYSKRVAVPMKDVRPQDIQANLDFLEEWISDLMDRIGLPHGKSEVIARLLCREEDGTL
ncbi:MAG: hypothetical protein HC840_10500 [Leptolyngbyaceae cyanobacterium RM2_2_4]|nr:hypothetical protein [Leptolyngbyaceae cyanobacterium RM2_2_4]